MQDEVTQRFPGSEFTVKPVCCLFHCLFSLHFEVSQAKKDENSCKTQSKVEPNSPVERISYSAQCTRFTGTLVREYTHRGDLLVKAFAGVMEKVFQHFGNLVEGEAGFPVLGRMVPGWARCPGGSKQKLLLLVLFQEQVVKQALL